MGVMSSGLSNRRHSLLKLMGAECLQGREPSLRFLEPRPYSTSTWAKHCVGQGHGLPIRLLRTVSVQDLVLKDQEFHSDLAEGSKASRLLPPTL